MAKIDLSNIAITKSQKDSPLSNVDPRKTVDYAKSLRENKKSVKPIDYKKVGEGLINFAKTLLGGFDVPIKNDNGATIDESKIKSPAPLKLTMARANMANKSDIDKLSAVSGQNTIWKDTPVDINGEFDEYKTLSKDKLKAIKDVVRFYQKEFKMTPRADLYNDWEMADEGTLGMATVSPEESGQRSVWLGYTSSADDPLEKEDAIYDEETEWSPKNSSKIYRQQTPLHELGHVVSTQLFDNSVNKYKRDSDKYYETQERAMLNLVLNSAMDIGAYQPKKKGALEKEISKISGYAADSGLDGRSYDPYEVVSEALVDYYVNRDSASNLSKAIVNRLKRYGSTYGLRQAGGVRKRYETPEETLRRYKVIQ